MAYVNLNPIRAAICDTPETSDFTSVQQRLHTLEKASTSQNSQLLKTLNLNNY